MLAPYVYGCISQNLVSILLFCTDLKKIGKHSPHFPVLSEGNYLIVDGLNVIRVTRGPEKDIQRINHFNIASLYKTGQNFLFSFLYPCSGKQCFYSI